MEEILLGLQSLDDQARLGRPKSIDTEAVFQVIEANQTSNIRGVSGDSVGQSPV